MPPFSTAAAFHSSGLMLSRPDQHWRWRGDQLPADPLALIDRIIRGVANREFVLRTRFALRTLGVRRV